MATLQPYFGSGTQSGSKEDIKKQVIFWIKVGEGTIGVLSDFEFTFDGSALSYNFDLAVNLTDQDPGANSGSCSVTYNGNTDSNASYVVDGSKIKISAGFSGKSETFIIYPDGDKTMIDTSGEKNITVRLAPA